MPFLGNFVSLWARVTVIYQENHHLHKAFRLLLLFGCKATIAYFQYCLWTR